MRSAQPRPRLSDGGQSNPDMAPACSGHLVLMVMGHHTDALQACLCKVIEREDMLSTKSGTDIDECIELGMQSIHNFILDSGCQPETGCCVRKLLLAFDAKTVRESECKQQLTRHASVTQQSMVA